MEKVIKEFSGIDTSQQIVTFFVFVVLGVIFCVIYDFYRAMRYKLNYSKLVTFFTDIFYISLFTLIIFTASLVRSNGQIRIFALIGCFSGWLVTRVTVSRWICIFFMRIISGLIKFISVIKTKILTPLRVKTSKLCKRMKTKLKKLKNKRVKYSKKDKKYLQKDKEIVYNQEDKRHRRKSVKKTKEVPTSERNTFY